MARTNWNPEVGSLPANKGGTHGGINPAGGHVKDDVPAEGSSGNPGTEFPWNSTDATDHPSTTQIPPLRSL